MTVTVLVCGIAPVPPVETGLVGVPPVEAVPPVVATAPVPRVPPVDAGGEFLSELSNEDVSYNIFATLMCLVIGFSAPGCFYMLTKIYSTIFNSESVLVLQDQQIQ